jgi:archaeosine synthase
MFEVEKRNGLARVGKWLIEAQDKHIRTPNILFVEGEGISAPDVAEALITEKQAPHEKPYIFSSDNIFVNPNSEIKDNAISPALFYPPSQVELNTFAAKLNKEKLSSNIFVATGKEELVANSVYEVDAEVYVLANSLHLARNPKSFISTLINLRKTVGYHKMIYTPGLGSPGNIALLAYCGVDLFDSIPHILNARLGKYLTAQGKIMKDDVDEKFCFCPSCLSGKKDFESILGHNYYAALSELNLVRNAIRQGSLRELVESRIRSEPWMVSVLRLADSRYYSFQEMYFPVSGGPMIAASNDSLFRPEVTRFRERIKERYRKPPHPKVLLLYTSFFAKRSQSAAINLQFTR